ncbi:response regulator transcription factor [Parablautia muri]|uniref:Stage 0 sporulation protein A homolog n=1 Tax=Parablautia muri TaxID=2320879 RepID=A0A9X5GU88_9FIRM|nr:response regulator transcription factor [Parablautia muri]NBJ94796.1 DNA-binding response regulator [Parablautia muri]
MVYDCLMIEDEAPLAENTCKYLNLSGINAAAVSGVEEYLEFIKDNTTRMILLDINLGDGCGYNLCRQIREETQVPIIFVSCQTEEENILLGLNVGGDDFICKPYSLPILLAKVRAVLRRYSAGDDRIISFGECQVNMKEETLFKKGEPVLLKRMEMKLLLYLIRNRNRLVEKEELFKEVWQEAYVGDGTLNVHIRKLREKVEDNPSSPVYIITEYGKGYMFRLAKEN